ncbi:LLM class flavin-dependent oxidoreductase [Microbacterium terricola]|uniref:Monooxygenase n=1 Tax=Microbacterium terricola TaxID=344163 RepID=A0ABM8E1I0_9MICO|nr:LLM class flavin-dependent oxidoreductase [Microbacterium terricola]UYK40464.1 LLM class flavin-dependent oxidoreductase [Microbacterium terricola]BDV31814.1 monooxygenase [Microbacterium terricola]
MTRTPLIFAAGVFYPGGEHITGWRSPAAEPTAYLDIDYYTRFAQTAEAGRFATLFLADELYVWDRFRSGIDHGVNVRLEPFTLLSALSQVTSRIGLAATVSTTYNEPYHAARKLASLDHLSAGRAAWNLVTSASDEEARNFGREAHLEHATRYRRGAEFVEVVNGLWDSWDDDAFVFDKRSGRFADRSKLHVLDHRGDHFAVRGPLNIPRPVQGHPPLFQAGASEAGRDLAGRTADAVFTLGGGDLAGGRAQYDDYKRRAVAAGRTGDDLSVLPWFSPIIGATAAEAEERFRELARLTPDRVQVDLLSHYLGHDLGDRDLDGPFDFEFDLDSFNQSKSGYAAIQSLSAQGSFTIRELAWEVLRRRFTLGTPDTLAAHLIEQYEQRAADGFILMAPTLPDTLEAFVGEIVPRLTDHGIYPAEYEGDTLRDHLGLARPRGRYAA